MNDVVPLLKHNPSAQDPAVLEAITVQRETLINALVESVVDVKGGLRHHLLVGPRGMGKTHILSLVASRAGNDPSADQIIVAWLDEDPWAIRTYDKFLAAIVERVAAATADSDLAQKAEALRSGDGQGSIEGEELLREAVGSRRLVLLVENLDEVFRRIRPEGQAKFRAFAEGWRQLLIIATSPQLFEGVQRHNSPFYGFFAIMYLDELSLDSAAELLKRVAELHGDTALLRFLGTETAKMRLEAIESLAGGHPRIWLLLAGCISVAAIDELVPLFLEALDELTPYYQDRLRELSDQQQEIVVLLSEAGGALSNRALAERSGISQNQVATILRELTTRAYIRSAEVDEDVATGDQRMSYWELREPLMRLCLDVKQARGKPLRMIVEFLRAWYGPRILDELARLPAEAELAAAYAGEAFRTLEGDLPTDDLLRGSPGQIVSRAERGIALAPERLDLKVVRVTGLLAGKRFGEARDGLRELVDAGAFTPGAGGLGGLLAMAERGLGAGPSLDVATTGVPEKDDPASPLPAALMARIYSALDRREEALAAFERAVELDPKDAALLQSYGVLASQMGRDEEALEALTKAIEIEPGSAAAHGNRSIALRHLGRHEEAIAASREATGLAPKNASVQDTLGSALSAAGLYEEALEAHSIACELEPDNARLVSNRGAALGQMGREEEALEAFAQAAGLDSDNADIQTNLALVFRRLGRPEQALSAIERSVELEPANADFWSYLGAVLTELQRHEEALAARAKAVELDPGNGLFQSSLAGSLHRVGRAEEALAAHERAAELMPGDVSILSNLAAAFGSLNRYEEALAVLERTVELDPENPAVIRNQCAALWNLDRNEEALAAIEKAIDLSPADAKCHDARGVVLLDLDRLEDALAAVERAIELEPASGALHDRLGALLERAGHLEDALAQSTEATVLEPEEAGPHNSRAGLLRQLDRLDEAEAAAARAVELDDREPVFLFTSSEVALARRDVDLALTRLRTALASWEREKVGWPGETHVLCQILWERFEAGPDRSAAIAGVVRAYEGAGALGALGSGIVACIPLFVDAAVSQQEADAWVADWIDAAGGDELEIPLNLLRAARGWKLDRDRVHLLNLPLEQREILTGLLK